MISTRPWGMMAAMVATIALAIIAPATAELLDQTIATWTLAPKPGIRFESALVVKLGVIESRKVEFCKLCDPKGAANILRVDVTRVKSFFVNTDYQTNTENIGVIAGKDSDVLWIIEGVGPAPVDATGKGLAGFARFPLTEKAARDEAYKKLCALIHQTP